MRSWAALVGGILAVSAATLSPSASAAGPADLSARATQGERTVVSSPTSDAVPDELLHTWVAKVNGEPISLAFFLRRLAVHRASAYLHFSGRANALPDASFWTTEYEGQTPAQWLKEQTLKECVRVQVELSWAREEGLVADTSYASFLEALRRENNRRRLALARGEPIYGPQQYGEDEYFAYVMDNLRLALQERLAARELANADDALRSYYESVKDCLFSRGYRVQVMAIEVSASGERGGSGRSAAEAEALVGEARARIVQGQPFDEVARCYDDYGAPRRYVFDDQERPADRTRLRAAIREAAMRLAEGEVTEVLRELDTFYLLKCVKREFLGYLPFEEVRPQVRRRYAQERYEQRVAERIQQADIEVNCRELERIEIR